MSEKITISPYVDDERGICFSNIRVAHVNCKAAEMKQSHNPINKDVSLKCECGFSITLPSFGEAERKILQCAIDEQTHDLNEGTYYSSESCAVKLVPSEL